MLSSTRHEIQNMNVPWAIEEHTYCTMNVMSWAWTTILSNAKPKGLQMFLEPQRLSISYHIDFIVICVILYSLRLRSEEWDNLRIRTLILSWNQNWSHLIQNWRWIRTEYDLIGSGWIQVRIHPLKNGSGSRSRDNLSPSSIPDPTCSQP